MNVDLSDRRHSRVRNAGLPNLGLTATFTQPLDILIVIDSHTSREILLFKSFKSFPDLEKKSPLVSEIILKEIPTHT